MWIGRCCGIIICDLYLFQLPKSDLSHCSAIRVIHTANIIVDLQIEGRLVYLNVMLEISLGWLASISVACICPTIGTLSASM